MFKIDTRSKCGDHLPIIGYSNNQQRNHFSRVASTSTSDINTKFVLLCILLPWLPYIAVRIAFNRAESTTASFLEKRQSIARDLKIILQQRAKLQEQERTMHDETGTLFAALRKIGALEEYEAHEIIEEHYLNQIEQMNAHYKSQSRLILRERFGNGVIKVAMDIKVFVHVTSFVIELSGAKSTPHAVHVFVDLVNDKAYEGAVMRKNDATLSVSPKLKENQSGLVQHDDVDKQKRTMVFAETSKDTTKYALCFSGLGPSFYIALQDTQDEAGGTCFGMVTDNSHMLDTLPVVTNIIGMKVLSS